LAAPGIRQEAPLARGERLEAATRDQPVADAQFPAFAMNAEAALTQEANVL
jgi:hypothetical protein